MTEGGRGFDVVYDSIGDATQNIVFPHCFLSFNESTHKFLWVVLINARFTCGLSQCRTKIHTQRARL
jgi:hypothetical protein